jgi:diguanylate cyclase (GGDEF)-like protein
MPIALSQAAQFARRRIWPGSLHSRLLILLVVAMLPLLATHFRNAASEERRLVALASEHATRLAAGGVARANDAVSEARNTLHILAQIPLLLHGSNGACSDQLQRIVQVRGWATGIFALDAHGSVMCASDPQTLGISIADRSYVQTAIANRDFFAGDFIIGRKSRIPMIGSALPVFDSNGNLMRIFVATIATKWFEGVAAEIVAANPGSTATLVDGGGIVLADAPLGGNEVGLPLQSRSMVDALGVGGPMAETGRAFVAIGDDGVERHFGTAAMPHSHARLVIGLSRDTILGEVARGRREALVNLLVSGLGLAMLLWLFAARTVGRPVDALVDHCRAVRQGDFSLRAAGQSWPVELVTLQRGLNFAAARLARRELQLRRAQQELRNQATVDHLTGLPNRRGFDLAAEALWRPAVTGAAPMSVLMVDADFFKQYNDTYGHGAGDDVLRKIAGVLKRAAREEGLIAARMGGEEFSIILPGVDGSHAMVLAETLCRRVAALELPHRAAVDGVVTVSIGVAAMPMAVGEIGALIEAADAALYLAKASGRNRAMGAARLADLEGGTRKRAA